MAVEAKNINPLDLRVSTGVGIGIPFSQQTGVASTFTTQEATKANLINYLLTNRNERVFSPLFGGSIPSFIFESITDSNLDALEKGIQDLIEENFPTLEVEEVTAQASDPDYQTVYITIRYRFRTTRTADTVILSLNR
jgi:phage baseplate assembly protein W